MTRNSVAILLTALLQRRTGFCVSGGRRGAGHFLLFGLMMLTILTRPESCRAVLLWSDLGSTEGHETGEGTDILGGVLRRDNSASDTLYFKFHVDPLSDATTEEYFAAFQLFEGNQER